MPRRIYNPRLPHATQKAAAWYCQCYPGWVRERYAILESSPKPPEVLTKGTKISDPTVQKVARLEGITKNIKAIEFAKTTIEEGYREGVWNNAVYKKPFPDYGSVNTWKYHKNRFLYVVAMELSLPLERD